MPHAHKRRLRPESYTVTLICPLEIEFSAVRYMLDEEHVPLPQHKHDGNIYAYGTMSGHNVVIGTLPSEMGINPAACIAAHMARSFPNIRLSLLVGIGGGVPSVDNDIRLGDVVVSDPMGTLRGDHGGVIRYDRGMETVDGFQRMAYTCPPPEEWAAIAPRMQSAHRVRRNRIAEFVGTMVRRYPLLAGTYSRPPPESDLLFPRNYIHENGEESCRRSGCRANMAVRRAARSVAPDESRVFYGLIASGNCVMKNGVERDNIASQVGGALCFEMEAAGMLSACKCIVIRGISDYSDSHKNDCWHGYAAAAAAGLAKEILTFAETSFVGLLQAGPRRDDPRRMEFLNALRTCDYQGRKDAIPRHITGTCEWLIENPQFQGWLAGKSPGLLWISAGLGYGKSVLARYVVDEVLSSPSASSSFTVCYFFFGGHERVPLSSALCCILHQLFRRQPELLSEAILASYEQENQRLSLSAETLWDTLAEVADRHFGDIAIILDGLDMLDDEDQDCLIERMRRLYNDEMRLTNLRILFTSRPHLSIQRSFQNLEEKFPLVHLNAEEMLADKITGDANIVIKIGY